LSRRIGIKCLYLGPPTDSRETICITLNVARYFGNSTIVLVPKTPHRPHCSTAAIERFVGLRCAVNFAWKPNRPNGGLRRTAPGGY